MGPPWAYTQVVHDNSAKPIARIEKWKEQLLDLSLRNRLLNYQPGRQSLPLLCSDPAAMESALALGRPFNIALQAPLAGALHDSLVEDAIVAAPLGEELQAKLQTALAKNLLYSRCPEQLIQKRLLQIYRAARLSLEEGGANTLFVAIGFLRWFETSSSDRARYAPLILVPVELSRQSARDSFKLQRIDEDPQVNVTLTEKFRKDFGIELAELAEPPRDDLGLDVSKIMEVFRKAIAVQPRWQIVADVHLGLFSFTKFLMWRDLELRTDEIMESDVVKHLALGATGAFSNHEGFNDPAELDDVQRVQSTFCPLNADSSQLVSVLAADKGQTFVLEGPPGTGKSQTITNIIAQCLANDKTVLFVSAKMEALKVVHQRLERVGLGDFCLELHSNKARKRHIVQQLHRSIEKAALETPESWDRRAAELEELRQQLNQYVAALHEPRETGESFFTATSQLVGLRDTPEVPLVFDELAPLTAEAKAKLEDRVGQLATAAEPLGRVHRNPWRHAVVDEWSEALHQRVADRLGSCREKALALRESAATCATHLKAESFTQSLAALENNRTMAELLLGSPCPREALLFESAKPAEEWAQRWREIHRWICHGRRHDQLKKELAGRYSEELFRSDRLGFLHAQFVRWCSYAWPLRTAALFLPRREVRRFSYQRSLPDNRTLARDLEHAVAISREAEHMAKFADQAHDWFGSAYQSVGADWDSLERSLQWVVAFQKSLQEYLDLEETDNDSDERRRHLLHLASVDGVEHSLAHRIQQAFEGYLADFDSFMNAKQGVEELLGLDGPAFVPVPGQSFLDRVVDQLDSYLSSLPQLRDWCHYLHMGAAARESGLSPLAEAHLDGRIATNDLLPVFQRSYYHWWVNSVAHDDPLLGAFHSADHCRKIQNFVDLDRRLIELTQQVVQARLVSRIPSVISDAPVSSSLGILLREIKKKTRHLPTRVLFSRMPELLQRLKPCMLMSPLSVAQYISPGFAAFDVVVFDEASQIPTHDAIGSIARGKQLIVVGDSKQLPPTTFFQREDDGDGVPSEEEIVELESILDECVAARLPSLTLRWHYRSRHEDLIAFSNQHYYGGRLHTYPSSLNSHSALGVEWRAVPNGVYERSKSRTNRAEAEEVVGEIVRMLRHPAECYRSIGVVTFSVAQQQLIEDLLEEARHAHPTIDRFFGSDVREPVFVKNLENVQGDERDVMLFSVCYGPDRQGKVWLNFGPLNVAGGQRRLNVAITRARERLIVFSTLRPEQIDLERATATGARHLRTFLEYVSRGSQRSNGEDSATVEESHGPFERDVAEALVEKGWHVHREVGCSHYRVDLAVLDPRDSGRYLLGVVCDGAYYRSGKTARDRERLRHEVLEGLGWSLHRLWLMDWRHDPEGELAAIERALALRLKDKGTTAGAMLSSNARPAHNDVEADAAPMAAREQEGATNGADLLSERLGTVYELFPTDPPAGSSETFYEPLHDDDVQQKMLEIAKTEAPIHRQDLARRLASLYGIRRLTKRVGQRVDDVARALLLDESLRLSDDFYWRGDQDSSSYATLRVPDPGNADTRRPIDRISLAEIRHGALTVLTYSIALDLDDLVRETARVFGLSRPGKAASQRIEQAIRSLIQDQRCVVEGTRVRPR
jgi:very-short-patch-repair endonuclease